MLGVPKAEEKRRSISLSNLLVEPVKMSSEWGSPFERISLNFSETSPNASSQEIGFHSLLPLSPFRFKGVFTLSG